MGSTAACLAAASKPCFFFWIVIIFTKELGTYKSTKVLQELSVLGIDGTETKPEKSM